MDLLCKSVDWVLYDNGLRHERVKYINLKIVFTINQDEISSWGERNSVTREFLPGMKRADFYPGMKFSLKENVLLGMKTYNKSYHFFHY